ncbi:type II secretion system minor pseudopilin [Rhodopirellula bahusiensis]|uniref:General secretion pathway protein GspK n=1 Tax=Rhodopirellula bahusiensis TaxID=2014065 RepID=A0A2G1W9A6_9BACT|nr:type II secretion system protein GspK [Rhodopirellula bahusiensis]PHQ35624.1 general secretion pathway protein GspK [Rhodopirellula bahusiensis]
MSSPNKPLRNVEESLSDPTVAFAAKPIGRQNRRRGFFLVLVLIVIAVATMAVYSFTDLMIAADETAYLTGDLVQARATVDSGIEAVRLTLAQPSSLREDAGGVFNNPNMFQGVPITDGSLGNPTSNFTVLAPGLTEMGTLGGIRYGLQNESARLNVNALVVLEENSEAISMLTGLSGGSVDAEGILGGATASEDSDVSTENIAVTLLMTLPGMDVTIADAILDWIDEDTEPRENGCEDEYYTSLATPYAAANGPIQTVEELLLVRGVTPQLLFGADSNRNGVLDSDEQQRYAASIETPGVLGWASYLTVHGAEANKTMDGDFRVNINGDDLEVLYEELMTAIGDEVFASFIVAYRIGGQSSLADSVASGASAEALAAQGIAAQDAANADSESEGTVLPWSVDALAAFDLTGGADIEFNQVLDLIDAKVTQEQNGETVTYTSPLIGEPTLLAEFLPFLMDQLTTQDGDVLPGRINLNECPAELLMGVPLVDSDTMTAILEARSQDSGGTTSDRTHETWPLTEGLVTVDQMRALLPLVTARGDVFRAQVIGFDSGSGLAARGEAIIDATTPNPRIVHYRDLTHLGRGFDLSVLGGNIVVPDNN